MLLLTHSLCAQSKWVMTPDSMAHGPANDVFKWATYRAVVNEQSREKTISYYLLRSELTRQECRADALDSALASHKEVAFEAENKAKFWKEKYEKCQSRRPLRGLYFVAGLLLGAGGGYKANED